MTIELIHVLLTVAGLAAGWFGREQQLSPLQRLIAKLTEDADGDGQIDLLQRIVSRSKDKKSN